MDRSCLARRNYNPKIGRSFRLLTKYLSLPENKNRVNSKIWNLRAFVNWSQGFLMSSNSLESAKKNDRYGLDLGCNKGVDIKKWLHCDVNKVTFIDKDYRNIKECEDRYHNMRERNLSFYSADFINKDFTRDDFEIERPVSIVSSHFSIYKAFESEEQASIAIMNIGKSLALDGVFVATITSCSTILKYLKMSKNSKEFGNDIFSINFNEAVEEDSLNFGTKFSLRFTEENTSFEEYLVKESLLDYLMESVGLRLLVRKPMMQMYVEEFKNSCHQRNVMSRLSVIRLNHNLKHPIKSLKLTESERELVDLYDVVVYKKEIN